MKNINHLFLTVLPVVLMVALLLRTATLPGTYLTTKNTKSTKK